MALTASTSTPWWKAPAMACTATPGSNRMVRWLELGPSLRAELLTASATSQGRPPGSAGTRTVAAPGVSIAFCSAALQSPVGSGHDATTSPPAAGAEGVAAAGVVGGVSGAAAQAQRQSRCAPRISGCGCGSAVWSVLGSSLRPPTLAQLAATMDRRAGAMRKF